jgi:sterol desaturase/sphingolipid hydroxylase (fatty acid hydroxylase superfamily)
MYSLLLLLCHNSSPAPPSPPLYVASPSNYCFTHAHAAICTLLSTPLLTMPHCRSVLTLPIFFGEVRGWSRLYVFPSYQAAVFVSRSCCRYDGMPAGMIIGDFTLPPWCTLLAEALAFLAFTDCFIYWIHRGLHRYCSLAPRPPLNSSPLSLPASLPPCSLLPFHCNLCFCSKLLYAKIHKPHHLWKLPTPFASHAFHPCDGVAQSMPYSPNPFVCLSFWFKITTVGLGITFSLTCCRATRFPAPPTSIFATLRHSPAVSLPLSLRLRQLLDRQVHGPTQASSSPHPAPHSIHDCNFVSDFGGFLNSSAHHTDHHLHFDCNFGQCVESLFCHRCCAPYRCANMPVGGSCVCRYTTFWDRVFGTYREPTQKTHPDEILQAALQNAKKGGVLDAEFDPNTDGDKKDK